ncbi:hypothetical protein Tco_0641931, partial [Tanacetum coccineum]
MKLTCLCFADDLLLFFHGDINSVNILKESINDFGAYSDRLPVKNLGVPLTSKRIRLGRLQSFISYRDVYNARLNPDMVVKDLVGNGICIWPSEWVEKYPNLSLIQNVVIDEFKQDEMVWRSHNGREGYFSIREELNNCLFRGEKRSIDELYEVFVESIRLRLSSLKAKLTKAVTKAQLNWNIKMSKKVE